MFDSTTEFMKGAILGYSQSHEPEEVAMLFDDVYLNLEPNKAANISAAIAGRFLYIACKVRDDKKMDEFIGKIEKEINK